MGSLLVWKSVNSGFSLVAASKSLRIQSYPYHQQEGLFCFGWFWPNIVWLIWSARATNVRFSKLRNKNECYHWNIPKSERYTAKNHCVTCVPSIQGRNFVSSNDWLMVKFMVRTDHTWFIRNSSFQGAMYHAYCLCMKCLSDSDRWLINDVEIYEEGSQGLCDRIASEAWEYLELNCSILWNEGETGGGGGIIMWSWDIDFTFHNWLVIRNSITFSWNFGVGRREKKESTSSMLQIDGTHA